MGFDFLKIAVVIKANCESENIASLFQRDDVVERLVAPASGVDSHDGFRRGGRRDIDQEHHDPREIPVETHRKYRQHRGDRGGGADHAEDATHTGTEARAREERHRHTQREKVVRRAGQMFDRLHILCSAVLRVHYNLRSREDS